MKFKQAIKNVIYVMSPWQITIFAVLSWVLAIITMQTFYLWMVSIRDESIVLSGLNHEFINLFGSRKFQDIMASPLLLLVKYAIVLSIALIIFYTFYRIKRQKLLKKQLKTINYALERGKLVAIAGPILEVRELEMNIKKLRQRQRDLIKQEQQAQQAKNDLITNVSHDLRTPLTSILGYLGYIYEDRYRDEVELRYYTELVYGKARHLHKLIDDLFSYTRLESPEFLLARDRLNMVELLRQLVAEFDGLAREKGMEIREDYASENLIVTGDGKQIMRLFENLFSNALRYGCESPYIELSAQKSEDWAVISVTNYGEEIPALDLPHLFDRFYKVDKTRTTSGTGLGLAIAKSIVEKHGGLVTAESKNRKTVFTVKLPLISV